MTGSGVDCRDLALAERVIQGLVDQRGRNPHSRRRVAVDLDRDVRRGNLLVRGDIFELGHLLHLTLENWRPVIELIDVGVGQRVLIKGPA